MSCISRLLILNEAFETNSHSLSKLSRMKFTCSILITVTTGVTVNIDGITRKYSEKTTNMYQEVVEIYRFVSEKTISNFKRK